MPNKRISDFPLIPTIVGNELIPIVTLTGTLPTRNKYISPDLITGKADRAEGFIVLMANVNTHVPFGKTLSSIHYNIGKYAYETNGDEALVNINTRTNTGFWAQSVVNCTLEWNVKVR